MAELAMSEMTTYRWSFEKDVQHYAAAGIPAIGVWRQKLADYGEHKGMELLASAGMKVSSLQWAGGFTGSDGHTHSESIEDAKEAIRQASKLKAGCLILHSGARGVHTHNHARRLFRSAIDRLLPVAELAGVTLAIEPMSRECGGDWTFLNSIDEALELVNAYKHACLQLVFDSYHWGHESDTLDRLKEIVRHAALIQLGDARHPPKGEQNRMPLGEGALPLSTIVDVAVRAGYDGFFEVELVGEEIEVIDYEQLLARSKQAFNDWTDSNSRTV